MQRPEKDILLELKSRGLNVQQIADELCCEDSEVRKWFTALKIELPPRPKVKNSHPEIIDRNYDELIKQGIRKNFKIPSWRIPKGPIVQETKHLIVIKDEKRNRNRCFNKIDLVINIAV